MRCAIDLGASGALPEQMWEFLELRHFDVCTQCVIFYVSVQKYLRLFHNQSGSDEVLRDWRDILEELIWESQIILRDIAEGFLLCLASKGRVARQQDVCQHTNRPITPRKCRINNNFAKENAHK